jgi:hypothetical protein
MTKATNSNPLALTEKHLQDACSRVLELDGWRRLKTDPVSRREWGKGFGELGMADDLYIRCLYRPTDRYIGRALCQVMWIEWKKVDPRSNSAKATKAAQHQKDWHLLERKRGALTLIAGEDFPATFEGFLAWYRTSGLMRRQ